MCCALMCGCELVATTPPSPQPPGGYTSAIRTSPPGVGAGRGAATPSLFGRLIYGLGLAPSPYLSVSPEKAIPTSQRVHPLLCAFLPELRQRASHAVL